MRRLPNTLSAQPIGTRFSRGILAKIDRHLLGAHLGVVDRQLGTLLKEIEADGDGGGLPSVIGVSLVDAVGRRP